MFKKFGVGLATNGMGERQSNEVGSYGRLIDVQTDTGTMDK